MARAKDLAGLAALGFLGYKMSQMGKGKDDAGDQKTSSYTKDTKKVEAKDEPFKATNASSYTGTTKNNASNIGFGGGTDSDKNLKLKSSPKAEAKADAEDKTTTTSSTSKTPGGDEKRVEGNKPMPSLKEVEKKAAARKDLMAAPSNKTSKSTDAMRNASRAAAAQMRRSKLSPVDQIPGQSRRAPEGGERIDSTELGRNVSNTMSALTPIGGGLGKIGAEISTAGRTQKAYNAAQAERRAAEGMSPAEALAARQAAREAKTLNPNAWLAGPKGMAENFRKGGMTASRRGDGIATKGKTRGRIC
jgi:hypothetical protein